MAGKGSPRHRQGKKAKTAAWGTIATLALGTLTTFAGYAIAKYDPGPTAQQCYFMASEALTKTIKDPSRHDTEIDLLASVGCEKQADLIDNSAPSDAPPVSGDAARQGRR